MNCKTNIIIIIDCQPFQHPLSLVLLRILTLCSLPTIPKPIPTLAKPQTASYQKLSWWCQANKLKSFLTTSLKLKSKLTVLSSHEQLPFRSWRIVRTILHSKVSYMNHKENFYITKSWIWVVPWQLEMARKVVFASWSMVPRCLKIVTFLCSLMTVKWVVQKI